MVKRGSKTAGTGIFREREKNSKYDSDKYQLLEELKKDENLPGPFVSDNEVQQYACLDIDDETKNKRLYKEIRYARFYFIKAIS